MSTGDDSDNVVHIAHRLRDSTAWSAADALRDALRSIEEGEINPRRLAVIYLTPTEDGGERLGFCVAGMTYESFNWLLDRMKLRLHAEASG